MHPFPPQFHNADHLLTRLDPRVKLLCALALLVMVLSCSAITFPLLTAGLSLVLCASLRVRPRLLMLRFAQPFLIALMVVLCKLFLTGHVPLFSWGFAGFHITGYRDGLLEGLHIAARIGGAVSIAAVLGFSTSFTGLMGALAWLRVPQGLVEVALLAWRYLFLLYDDAQAVYGAQRNRLGYAGYRRGLHSLGIMAGTLMIKAFDNSQAITTAMVQRGYHGAMPTLRHEPFRRAELLAGAAVLAVMGALWLNV